MFKTIFDLRFIRLSCFNGFQVDAPLVGRDLNVVTASVHSSLLMKITVNPSAKNSAQCR